MRLVKAVHLEPEEPGFLEEVAIRVSGFIEENQLVIDLPSLDLYGITPVLGGLKSGAGYTGGLRVEWFRNRLSHYASVEALASLEKYYGFKGVYGYDSDRYVGYGYARYWHLPEENFYGIGPNTKPADLAIYRLNEAVIGGLFGWSPLYHTLLGTHLSYRTERYGPGRDDDVPTIEEAYVDVPGQGVDVDYVALAAYAEFDTRNLSYKKAFGRRFAPTDRRLRGVSLDATEGIYFAAELTHYFDVASNQYGFTRLNLETQEYIPIRHGLQVIALRQYASLTSSSTGNIIPFYMMQTLGGAHTLRGFDSFRFRGRNLLLFNTEFRWQVMRYLDLALFVDAGHVFRELENVSLYDLEVGYGLGFRVKSDGGVIARLDVAHSREGFSLYLELGAIL